MGSFIEVNDTLKLKRGQGFPEELKQGVRYSFKVHGKRLYNLYPSRVFLVEEVEGKWNYVGHGLVMEQTIDAVNDETRGVFEVKFLYSPEYSQLANMYEAPAGKGLSQGVHEPLQMSDGTG